MKNNLIKGFAIVLIGILVSNYNCNAQRINENNVSSAAKATFKKAFPGAVSVKWEQEKKNYEANFKQQGKTMSALIEVNGVLIETETDMQIADLPKAIKDYLAHHYKDKKIKEAAIITKTGGEINYEAEVNGKDVLFSNNGGFIKEVKN